MADATWKVGNNLLDFMASRFGLLPLDGPHVRYCVASSMELERFPSTWHVDPERVVLTPYHHTLSDEELAAPTSTDGEIFAGGDSLRDYLPLIEAARTLSSYGLTIATRKASEGWAGNVPANVTGCELSPQAFNERTPSASGIVVPLEQRDDRGAGQTTYLNAMALGKAVIVTDVAGARDYIRDGETGLIVAPGDPHALVVALRRMLEDPDYVRRLGDAARRDVLDRFSPDRYVGQLLAVADAACAQ